MLVLSLLICEISANVGESCGNRVKIGFLTFLLLIRIWFGNTFFFNCNQLTTCNLFEKCISSDEVSHCLFSCALEQAIQFYCWKASELQTSPLNKKIHVVPLSPSQKEQVNRLKHMFLKDEGLAGTHFSSTIASECNQQPFDWSRFSAAATGWEAYCNKLGKEMLLSLPYWKRHQSIFSVPSFDVEIGIETLVHTE